MSCCHEPVAQKVRPGSARVLVTELSGSGQINPTPATKPCEDSETALGFCLSPGKLESLCGTWDLSHMTSLEICINTQENTLGNLGALLPKLVQLKLNNSMITSVRDLGTTLSHLQALWMSRCCLQDLEGISMFFSLKELYVAYNNVSDLSQVGMLENLQVLDLEGNDVDDLVQVQYLGLCGQLQTLTLEGNPVCVRPTPTAPEMADYRYRAAVRELVPQLHYLDNIRVEEDRQSSSGTMGEEWAILRNSIRDCNSTQNAIDDEEETDSVCPYSRPCSARRPASSLSCVWPLLTVGSRPHTAPRPMSATRSGILSPPRSRPGSADSDVTAVDAETSILTHGAGKILFCGNPVQAIRARREKLRTAPTKSTFIPRDLPIHIPEHTFDLEDPDVRERIDVFAELRAWREQHSRRLQAIETERLPQVLAIQYSDDEEVEDGNEEEGFVDMRNDSSDEEHGEEKHGTGLNAASPDSFQSLTPDLHDREALSPDMAQLSLCRDTTLSPSPPVSNTTAPGVLKLQGIRARRLRLSRSNSQHLTDLSEVHWSHNTGTIDADTDQMLQELQHVTRTNVALLTQATHHLPPTTVHVPHPPPPGVLPERLRDPCGGMGSSSVLSGNKHHHSPQTSKVLDRSAISRPHTARAALQKHHQNHILKPCRHSSQPD